MLCVALAVPAMAEQDGEAQRAAQRLFDQKYATIPARQPFGPEPANFDPDAVVPSSAKDGAAADDAAQAAQQLTEQENKLAGAVKVGIINVQRDGAAYVGFTDSSVNPPRNYYIKNGETRDCWKVLSIDDEKREATLAYSAGGETIELTFRLGGGLGGDAAAAGAAASPGVAAAAKAGLLDTPAPGSAAGRLRGRKERQTAELEAMRRERAEAEKRAEDAAAKAAEDRAAMQEQLAALADGLRLEREERKAQREREEQERREREERGEKPPIDDPDEDENPDDQ